MGRTEKQLADQLATELNISVRGSRLYVHRLLEMIREDLVATGRSELRGLGTFAVQVRPARISPHPVTGKPVHIPEVRAVRYRTSKQLKELLNSGHQIEVNLARSNSGSDLTNEEDDS